MFTKRIKSTSFLLISAACVNHAHAVEQDMATRHRQLEVFQAKSPKSWNEALERELFIMSGILPTKGNFEGAEKLFQVFSELLSWEKNMRENPANSALLADNRGFFKSNEATQEFLKSSSPDFEKSIFVRGSRYAEVLFGGKRVKIIDEKTKKPIELNGAEGVVYLATKAAYEQLQFPTYSGGDMCLFAYEGLPNLLKRFIGRYVGIENPDFLTNEEFIELYNSKKKLLKSTDGNASRGRTSVDAR